MTITSRTSQVYIILQSPFPPGTPSSSSLLPSHSSPVRSPFTLSSRLISLHYATVRTTKISALQYLARVHGSVKGSPSRSLFHPLVSQRGFQGRGEVNEKLPPPLFACMYVRIVRYLSGRRQKIIFTPRRSTEKKLRSCAGRAPFVRASYDAADLFFVFVREEENWFFYFFF